MVKTVFLNIRTTFFRIYQWVLTLLFYYPRELKFLWIDVLLALQYLWKNPHHVSRDFLRQRGLTTIYAYGETPLTTLDHIVKECRVLSKDVFYELGCGSGRTCFWMQMFVKCQVVGIDFLPAFITKANRVKKWAAATKLDFIQKDMLECDLQKATVIYLYGTCLDDQTILKLIEKFKHLRPNTKIITVSYPLTEYSDHFKLLKQFSVRYPWGKADVFLNQLL